MWPHRTAVVCFGRGASAPLIWRVLPPNVLERPEASGTRRQLYDALSIECATVAPAVFTQPSTLYRTLAEPPGGADVADRADGVATGPQHRWAVALDTSGTSASALTLRVLYAASPPPRRRWHMFGTHPTVAAQPRLAAWVSLATDAFLRTRAEASARRGDERIPRVMFVGWRGFPDGRADAPGAVYIRAVYAPSLLLCAMSAPVVSASGRWRRERPAVHWFWARSAGLRASTLVHCALFRSVAEQVAFSAVLLITAYLCGLTAVAQTPEHPSLALVLALAHALVVASIGVVLGSVSPTASASSVGMRHYVLHEAIAVALYASLTALQSRRRRSKPGPARARGAVAGRHSAVRCFCFPLR